MRTPIALLALLLSTSASAVPMQLNHQGRLMDQNGDGLDGSHTISFNLFEDQTGGTPVFTESIDIDLDNGFYAAVLGLDSGNPLKQADISSTALWIGLSVDSGPALDRQRVVSVPFAIQAETSTNVSGGIADVTELKIGGNTIIDADGVFTGDLGDRATLADLTCAEDGVPTFNGSAWVCGAPSTGVEWPDITSVPADIADGDDDTFAGTSCADGEILIYNTSFSAWGCGPDATLATDEVRAAITGAPIDLAGASTMGGKDILAGDVAWSLVTGIPSDIADGDANTQLSEEQVEGFIENGDLDLDGDFTAKTGDFSGSVRIGADNSSCSNANKGTLRYREPAGLEICNGDAWTGSLSRPIVFQAGCSTDITTDWRNFCLDRVVQDTAEDYLTHDNKRDSNDNNTTTGRITAKVAGYYKFSYTLNGSGHRYKYAQLFKNQSAISYTLTQNQSSQWRHISDSKVVWLDVGDFLYLRVYANAGINVDDDGGYGHPDGTIYNRRNWVTVEYLGADF